MLLLISLTGKNMLVQHTENLEFGRDGLFILELDTDLTMN